MIVSVIAVAKGAGGQRYFEEDLTLCAQPPMTNEMGAHQMSGIRSGSSLSQVCGACVLYVDVYVDVYVNVGQPE